MWCFANWSSLIISNAHMSLLYQKSLTLCNALYPIPFLKQFNKRKRGARICVWEGKLWVAGQGALKGKDDIRVEKERIFWGIKSATDDATGLKFPTLRNGQLGVLDWSSWQKFNNQVSTPPDLLVILLMRLFHMGKNTYWSKICIRIRVIQRADLFSQKNRQIKTWMCNYSQWKKFFLSYVII